MDNDLPFAAAAAYNRAIQPVTAGAAMLVPDISMRSFLVVELAASILLPGAAISGLLRPSRVGPSLLNQEIGNPGFVASYEATDMDL